MNQSKQSSMRIKYSLIGYVNVTWKTEEFFYQKGGFQLGFFFICFINELCQEQIEISQESAFNAVKRKLWILV